MRRLGLGLALGIVLSVAPASAQSTAPTSDTPLVETSVGFTDVRARTVPATGCCFHMQGVTGSVGLPTNRWLSLVTDAGFYREGNVQSSGFSLSIWSMTFGPRVSYRKMERFTPFVQWLLGAAHATGTLYTTSFRVGSAPPKARTDFAMIMGGGLDVSINHSWAVRVPEVDWFYTRFPNGVSNSQDNLRITVGVVYRSWRPHAEAVVNRPPSASCSMDRTSVIAGSGETVRFSVTSSDPDGDPMTYSYTATGGTIEGTGPEARWTPGGITAGRYTANVKVDDGKGGEASCNMDLEVERMPNRAPIASISVERNFIQAGERTGVTCVGADTDNDSLTYGYTVTGGEIAGGGTSVQFDSTGLPQGTYTVKCEVSDGRGGIGDSAANIQVQQPPPPNPPQIAQLEVKLALHSIYFPTAQPTVANPNGGLLASQQMTLDTLASDFKEYLGLRPEALLMLTGYADIRGSSLYNQALSERRVERTKSYLVARGVPADRIETMAVGKTSNLSADDARQLIQEDPDLNPAERQRLLANLRTIVLANNRRVDVALSTTGEQSVRRFPFNARDAATLLNRRNTGARTGR